MLKWPKGKNTRALLRIAIFFISVPVIDQSWVWWDHRITPGPSTTLVLSPLSPEGLPDYVAALEASASAGVTTDNNAAIAIFRHTRMFGGQPIAARAVIYKIWGIPQPAGDGLLVNYKDWAQSHRIAVPASDPSQPTSFDGIVAPPTLDPCEWEEQSAQEKSWSAAAQPLLARWIADTNSSLDAVARACALPRFHVPIVLSDDHSADPRDARFIEILLPDLAGIRLCANTLMARAMMRLDAGDVPGFTNDVVACMQLARLLAQEPELVPYLVAVSIDTLAMHALQSAAAREPIGGQNARLLLQTLQRLPEMPPPSRALDEAERYAPLDALCALHRGSNSGQVLGPVAKVTAFIPFNYNAAMRDVNSHYDRYKAAMELPSYPDRRSVVLALDRETEAYRTSGMFSQFLHLEQIIPSIFTPAMTLLNDAFTTNLVERDLARTALALRALHAEGSPFPASLDELPRESRIDQFSGKNFVYRRTAEGYQLYSVGANLKDDGGTRAKTYKAGDLVVDCPR